jgi:hypothetical protein
MDDLWTYAGSEGGLGSRQLVKTHDAVDGNILALAHDKLLVRAIRDKIIMIGQTPWQRRHFDPSRPTRQSGYGFGGAPINHSIVPFELCAGV